MCCLIMLHVTNQDDLFKLSRVGVKVKVNQANNVTSHLFMDASKYIN